MTSAGIVSNLHSFAGEDGRLPIAGLRQAADGNLYGVTYGGGATGGGTAFRITTTGVFRPLSSFPTFLGGPASGLVEAKDGVLYGAVTGGGPTYYTEAVSPGALFSIAQDGRVRFSHVFTIANGKLPWGDLIQGSDGALYGSTFWGGAEGHGTIFGFSADAGVRTVHSFWGGIRNPIGLTLGTLFKMTAGGAVSILHSFSAAEGGSFAALIEVPGNQLYGTSVGTVFRLDAERQFSTMHLFNGEGAAAVSGVAQGPDGHLYGTLIQGREAGKSLRGSVYRITLE